MTQRLYVIACAALLLLAGGLRLHQIGERSVWLDEAVTANQARGSVGETVRKIGIGNSSPVVHPVVLNVVQRWSRSALAVRAPSVVASMGAILAILLLPLVGIDRKAAVLVATVLAVSPSQIRYAQEAREYAFAVLVAALLIWSFCGCIGDRRSGKRLLALTAFLAPLVQYGLALLVGAVLLTLGGALWRLRGLPAAVRVVVPTAAAFFVGAGVTWTLTLRHQWHVREAWYLEPYLFGGASGDVSTAVAFLVSRVPEMLSYVTLGAGWPVLVVPLAGAFFQVLPGGTARERWLLGLGIISVAMVGLASLLGLYPCGGIRQDLFLAPVLATTIGIGGSSLISLFRWRRHVVAASALAVLIVCGGAYGIQRHSPWEEIEDVQPIISALEKGIRAGDTVYVYYGATPALRFYGVGGRSFVYGGSHRENPRAYAEELRSLVEHRRGRVWLVFSHVYAGESEILLRDLRPAWRFERVARAHGASLWVGRRESGVQD